MPVKSDPSSRSLIFNSVTRNEDFGNMELLSYISITDSLKCDAAFDAQSWTSLGSLHLFKQLAVESRDLSHAEKKVTVVKPEQIFKMTNFDHFE